MEVIGWTSWDDPNYPKTKVLPDSMDSIYMKAVADELKSKGYQYTGFDHQNRDGCTPIMSDGTKYAVSLRHWGQIMALAYGGDYVDWAFGG